MGINHQSKNKEKRQTVLCVDNSHSIIGRTLPELSPTSVGDNPEDWNGDEMFSRDASLPASARVTEAALRYAENVSFHRPPPLPAWTVSMVK